MRSFVSEVVHHSLHRAARQIGLPPLPTQVFVMEVSRALTGLDGRFPDDHDSLVKLWRSIWHGEIIAAQVQEDVPVFYVRGGQGGMGIVVRLLCEHDQWSVDRVVSVYHRPLFEARWLSRTTTAAVIVAAAAIGFASHGLSAHSLVAKPVQTAASQITQAPAIAKTTTVTAAQHARPSLHSRQVAPKVTVAPPQKSSYTFTLGLGMPLYNLAQFLADKKLVPSAMGFDMTMKQDGLNSDVQAGTYTFTSGMTVQQIIHVLKSGPVTSGS